MGQIRTGVVESLKFPNKAVVRLEPLEGQTKAGQAVFEELQNAQEEREGAAADAEYCVVKGALPGQRVSLAVTKVCPWQ